MNRQGLINQVKIKLDEYTPEGVSHLFDELIGPLMDEACRKLLLTAPLHLVPPTEIPVGEAGASIKYDDDSAFIPFPPSFLRLYLVKFPLWSVPVRDTIKAGTYQELIQTNQYLRSGTGRPSVREAHKKLEGDTTLTRYLQCAKVEKPVAPATITPEALYVKALKPEELPEELVESLTWLTTYLVMLSQADMAQMAPVAFGEYEKSINI